MLLVINQYELVLLLLLGYILDTSYAHLCIMKNRKDHFTDRMRWSLPLKERCVCQVVVAPSIDSRYNCPADGFEAEDLWFTDDPDTVSMRENWTPEKLDQLLERNPFCYINECDANPCENDGICDDDVGIFTCACAAGFAGDTCENDINKCDPNPCENDGICEDGIGIFTCACAAGFVGEKCENDINECDPNPCENDGICEDGIEIFTCACAAGFVGEKCENDINECDPIPCENDGICEEGIGIFTCACAAGFAGDTCENDINECDSNPCENDGICEDGIGIFTCACAAGFVGEKCENDVEAPSFIFCPANQTKQIGAEERTTIVTWATPQVTDNSGHSITATCNRESTSQFAIGHTDIVCEAQDASENKAACSFTVIVTACFDYLGMENGDIPNENINASHYFSTHPPSRARLDGAGFWSAKGTVDKPWIQADMGYQTYVSGVVTQGEGGSDQTADYVTTFTVSTSLTGSTNHVVLEEGNGILKIFNANIDVNSKVVNHFTQPVYARAVRITAESRNSNGGIWAMRFELLGCKR